MGVYGRNLGVMACRLDDDGSCGSHPMTRSDLDFQPFMVDGVEVLVPERGNTEGQRILTPLVAEGRSGVLGRLVVEP